ALRSFGEPMGVARTSDGRLYVADVANHRVQVFDDDGRVVAAWGKGEPAVTDAWYGGRRRHYVAGRAPGTAPGALHTPLAVTTVEARSGTRVYVLDASKRLQAFDENGKVVTTWQLPAELEPAAGVGGSG